MNDTTQKPLRILVVDDDEGMLESTKSALEKNAQNSPYALTVETLHVEEATKVSPEVALKKVQSGQYDLLITDVSMGRDYIDGFGLATAVKNYHPRFPVIIGTGGRIGIGEKSAAERLGVPLLDKGEYTKTDESRNNQPLLWHTVLEEMKPKPLRILITEDYENAAEPLNELLGDIAKEREQTVEIVTTATLKEAGEKLKEAPFDVWLAKTATSAKETDLKHQVAIGVKTSAEDKTKAAAFSPTMEKDLQTIPAALNTAPLKPAVILMTPDASKTLETKATEVGLRAVISTGGIKGLLDSDKLWNTIQQAVKPRSAGAGTPGKL